MSPPPPRHPLTPFGTWWGGVASSWEGLRGTGSHWEELGKKNGLRTPLPPLPTPPPPLPPPSRKHQLNKSGGGPTHTATRGRRVTAAAGESTGCSQGAR